MRVLTLDEKICFKGIFERFGLCLPRLEMKDAVYFFGRCCGNNIMRWHLYKKGISAKKQKIKKVLGDFLNNENFIPKIGDKVWTRHGIGVIEKTELISTCKDDPNAYLKYGVKLKRYMDRMPYYVGRDLSLKK